MSVQRYFSDDATLTLNDNAGTPAEVPVASLKGLTVSVTSDSVELTSGDTVLREAVKKRNVGVDVEIEVAAFDVSLMQTWLAGDSTATGTTSLTDTTDQAIYNIDATFPEETGGTTVSVTIDEVYFEEMPLFDTSEGEWVVKNLTGRGKTISDLSEA